MVPPGTAARAAASAFVLASPVRSASVMPLATWPPWLGSRCAAGATAAGAVVAPVLEEAVVVGVVSAVAVPISVAPTAPPAIVQPTHAAPVTPLPVGFIVSPFSCGPRRGHHGR